MDEREETDGNLLSPSLSSTWVEERGNKFVGTFTQGGGFGGLTLGYCISPLQGEWRLDKP